MPREPVTIAQVARAAGVSKATVSLVLNGHDARGRISAATRAVVHDWAGRLGYVPNHAARSLRRRRSNTITLLVWRLSSAYFIEIADGVRAAAEARGYDVNVVDARPVDAEVRTLQHVLTGAADGVIVATGYHASRAAAIAALRDLAERGAPVVMLLDRPPDPRISSIQIDDQGGAMLATRHLIGLGHRRIAHLSVSGGQLFEDDGSPQFDRFNGFERALDEAGLGVDPTWVIQGPGLMAGGYASAQALLERMRGTRRRPSAVFVYNDLAAVGVLRALHEAGVKVPSDMAVIGFHGMELGQYTTPALSSVTHARAELGEMAAQLLFEAMQRPLRRFDSSETVLPVELLIRESCGAVRAGRRPQRSPAL